MSLLQIYIGLFVVCALGSAIAYRHSQGHNSRFGLGQFVLRVVGFSLIGWLAFLIVPSVVFILMGNAQGPLAGFFAAPFGLLAGAGFGLWWCLRAKRVA